MFLFSRCFPGYEFARKLSVCAACMHAQRKGFCQALHFGNEYAGHMNNAHIADTRPDITSAVAAPYEKVAPCRELETDGEDVGFVALGFL